MDLLEALALEVRSLRGTARVVDQVLVAKGPEGSAEVRIRATPKDFEIEVLGHKGTAKKTVPLGSQAQEPIRAYVLDALGLTGAANASGRLRIFDETGD